MKKGGRVSSLAGILGMRRKWNYVVTTHKPTVVTHSCAGYFTSPSELNLIIAKCTRIELHLVTPDGLEPLLDVPIYGRIATLELFRPNGETQDLLFITTERHEYFVLRWDAKAYEFITRSKGNLSDQIGHPMDDGQIGIIDPDCRLIGLHLYDGLFKVIPFAEEGKLKEAFSIRFEPQALDMKFLYGCQKPTLVVLYQANKDARYVKAYEVPLKRDPLIQQREIWALNDLDNGAYLLIPLSLPLCGVLIIGENRIIYCNPVKDTYPIGRGVHSIRAYGEVDNYRYLLGDQNGGLHLLVITHEKEKVTGLTISHLGETSIASTISYLCDPFVYIGSSCGDSQLVKFSLQPGAESYPMEVLKRYDNLGPIGDFCIVDREKLGQSQVVTCSGAYKDGSLRIAQSKIGIREEASVELRGIKGIWSLRSVIDDPYDTFLVVSFIDVTRFYHIRLGETSREGFTSLENYALVEASIEGFNSEVQTLVCRRAVYDQLVQVTPNSVRLVNSISHAVKTEWFAPGPLTVATANSTQVFVAIGGGDKYLICLAIGNGVLNEMVRAELDGDVSCLDISPITEEATSSVFVAVGMWKDNSVHIYSLPKLDFIGKEYLGEALPRSVLMCSFDGKSYLFCGLGDGHLIHFELNMTTGELTGRKKVSVGTQPITLRTFLSKEGMRVFAASDTPLVIYGTSKKIVYGEVNNLEGVIHISPYNIEAFPNCLAIAKEGLLTLCTIDDKQKLHIVHSEHLGEHVLRISHQEQSQTIAICSVKSEDKDKPVTLVRLFDAQTLQRESSYKLDQFEHGCSILSCSFSDDANVYYVVGTAYIMLNQNECTKGRILVLQVVSGREFQLVAQMETSGAVYSLNAFNGKLLAAINENIQLYKWACKDGRVRKLQPECLYHGRGLSLFVQTRDDFIVVGDAMRSISLLHLKREENVIAELARDYNVNWLSAVEMLCEDIYLGARNNLELFTVIKHWEAAPYKRRSLEVVGMFHLGEFVNRFRHGPLVTLSQESEQIPTVIFGTVNGVIGVIASVPEEKYKFLEKLQRELRKVIKGVGELSNEQWRSSRQELKTVDSRNFLDGDLIESFLNLSKNQKEEIAREMEVTFGYLVKAVEDLTALY